MHYVIYPDMLFLSNFVMDYIVITCLEEMLHRRISIIRRAMAATIGGMYAVVIIIMPVGNALIKYFCTYILVAILIIYAAFGRCGYKECARRVILLYLVSFTMAGISNGMYMLMGINKLVKIMCTYIVLRICLFSYDFFIKKKSLYRDVVLNYMDTTVRVRGFVDTGNSLIDLATGKYVSIIEKDKIKGILANETIKEHIRMIPFHSVGEQNGIMEGYEIDSMIVDGKKIKKPIIAIYEGKLSTDDDYEMLIREDQDDY